MNDAINAGIAAALKDTLTNFADEKNWRYGGRCDPNSGIFDAIEMASKALASLGLSAAEAFQDRVRPWMLACFGPVIPFDKTERNHRFLEEAIELVQSLGCTQSEAHQLVDYVYGRPEGEPNQEVGGVMVTLAALCLANDLDMAAAGETELARIWTKVEKIRAKQAAKPKHSPLPEAPASTPKATVEREAIARIVDPANWSIRDRHIAGATNNPGLTDKERSNAFASAECYIQNSLSKADAILAVRLDEAAIRKDEREKQREIDAKQ